MTDTNTAGLKTKRRPRIFRSGTGHMHKWHLVYGWPSDSYPDIAIRGEQITLSQDNLDWWVRRQLLKPGVLVGKKLEHLRDEFILKRDVGGPFRTTCHYYEDSHPQGVNLASASLNNWTATYKGGLYAYACGLYMPSHVWPTVSGATEAAMISAGATAIARTHPTNPVAGVATALGELRQGIPQLPGKAAFKVLRANGKIKAVASEYLNLEFAVKPTISDVRKTAKAVKTSKEIVDQLLRDSGRLVRRRYVFPVVESIETTRLTDRAASPSLVSDMYVGGNQLGQLVKVQKTTTEMWFHGAFTYFIDPGVDAGGKLKRQEQIANKLYGTRISPEVMWNLTAWSWAADWVANMGDIMSNISAFSNDSLVMRWGYLMCKTTISDTYTLTGVRFNVGLDEPLVQTFTTVVKQRIKATPFGFGLNPDVDFTARQWAILVALGISRGKGGAS